MSFPYILDTSMDSGSDMCCAKIFSQSVVVLSFLNYTFQRAVLNFDGIKLINIT